MTIVWLFLIFGVTHQVVDGFPDKETCEQFRANVVAMAKELSQDVQVSQCLSRQAVSA